MANGCPAPARAAGGKRKEARMRRKRHTESNVATSVPPRHIFPGAQGPLRASVPFIR